MKILGSEHIKKIIPLILILLLIHSCRFKDVKIQEITTEFPKEDAGKVLKNIKQRGKIVVAADYNSTDYFIYRGEPLGYSFDLLKNLALYLNVKLEVIPENNIDKAFEMLNNEKVDLVAMDLAVTQERIKKVDFVKSHGTTRQVLVQRKPDNWRSINSYDAMEEALIREPMDLAGQIVHVQKNGSHKSRLINLMNEIGDSIHIVEDPDLSMENLIAQVADGAIDYTVSDERVAIVNAKYYPNIDVKTPVSFEQKLAWVVKKGQDSLRLVINDWNDNFVGTYTERVLFNKYFKNPRSVHLAKSEFNTFRGGKISKYDDIIRRYCAGKNWDWRLIASLIYQESKFVPNQVSWVGAFGLMQFMPNTAAVYGIDSLSTPEDQIRAGIEYLSYLDDQLEKRVEDPQERLKFVLAAYNVGIAHVYDAMALAEKYGKDPQIWESHVDYFILNKSNPKYYNDEVVKYGYARGEEPYKYVYQIIDRYIHYKSMIVE